MTSPREDPSIPPAILAGRWTASAERLLAAWGDFAPDHRRRLVARIVAAVAGPSGNADQAVQEAIDRLVAQWAASFTDGSSMPTADALRAAFLAIDGARRWPDQFLDAGHHGALRDALRRALPRPLPPAAPLEMPEQPL